MNQILSNQFININNTRTYSKKFKILFWICIIFAFVCIILFIYLKYNSSQKAKITKNLESSFEIKNLYNSTAYVVEKQIANVEIQSTPFVIGLLKIEKIDLIYPILSETNDELLEISPCRFYGPMPNEIGNLCIAGHNYANQTHFAKLHLLQEGDIVEVYDLNGSSLSYSIYSKLDMPANDISCLSQETSSLREITLITCNTIKGNRVVVKGREIT